MRYLTLLLILLLVGCKSKIKLVETHSTDTIYKTEVVKITEPVFSEVFIEKPCDSLGNLKPINIVSTTGKVTTSLKSVKNDLILEVNVDSIVDSRVEEFKSTYKTESVKETIIKTKVPKWAWYSLILNALLLVWTFRKLIF